MWWDDDLVRLLGWMIAIAAGGVILLSMGAGALLFWWFA